MNDVVSELDYNELDDDTEQKLSNVSKTCGYSELDARSPVSDA